MNKRTAVALSSTLLLCACGKPVPAEKAAFVGDWRSPSMALSITQDNFVVGIWFMTTTFDVSKAPYRDAQRWKMVVDGVELTKLQ